MDIKSSIKLDYNDDNDNDNDISSCIISSPSTALHSPSSSSIYQSPIKLPLQNYRYHCKQECSDRFIPIREPNNWNLRYNMIKETTFTSMMRYRNKDYNNSQSSSSLSSLQSSTTAATTMASLSSITAAAAASSPTAATTTAAMINGQITANTNHPHHHHHHHIQGGNIGGTNNGGIIGGGGGTTATNGGIINLITGSSSTTTTSSTNNGQSTSNQSDMFRNGLAYQCLLTNELLGAEIEDINEYKQIEERKVLTPLMNRNVFRFRTRELRSEPTSPYSLSPISPKSQKMLRSPRKTSRKISKMPFKILDAPELQDDFYLNLVDWSSTNILSVGLGYSVYLWSACTSQVTRLCDFTSAGHQITSVSWSERGNLVAVGTQNGFVQIWDVATLKSIKQFDGHTSRVGCLAWNCDLLSSGSRDRYIFQRDIRSPSIIPERKLLSHRQEVCGLKWSPDNQLLASGGNDNRIFIWNQTSNLPVQTYTEHLAAVKAIAWSPHHHGLLASGGGTSDRHIRFWNTLTGQPIQCVDTGSQVCNLAWSKHASELVSTHGYSQNQILVWKYPSLVQVAKLTGHNCRVLYLAMSPDGESIVTGAGDETLRFWNVFSKARSQKEIKSALDLFSTIR